ncbi:MAG: glycerol-3-phosphate dehydrogenase [Desulfobacterales bacterium CG23_combo_of_CG06-09_8_20_14_all_52_9]|nr:MAG: glycerol-3-phosphate dehydrogenase [Desulfobacterales bacterium CG23_combo_of_CG06-09_8_20_14_all_52_9]
MKPLTRNIANLSNKEYDLVIVGGGIFGVCAAWEAVQRGLSVAIVDKGDFAHATSANHFKIVHGGIRYLQHGDLYRIRESSRERSAFLRIAPHLVQPLPIVIPTYGHGIKGKELLWAGFSLYECLTFDRNRGLDADRRIARGELLPREAILDLFPGINQNGLTGGACFSDGQMYNPTRLVLSFLRSAVHEGADAANYVEAQKFLQRNNRVTGVHVKDVLSGDEFSIRGKMTLNSAGPWAHRLLKTSRIMALKPPPTFSRDLAFVVGKQLNSQFGIALSSRVKDTDTLFDRGGRHLFVVPWRGRSLIGVWHMIFDRPPEDIHVTEQELQGFIKQIHEAWPGLDIRINDISMINTGLTLFGSEDHQGEVDLSFGKRSLLIDHKKKHGIEGLVTLIGVRATTARGMAEKAINIILRKLGKKRIKSRTEVTPIYGGDMDCFQELLHQATEQCAPLISAELTRSLLHNYGSQYQDVLKYTGEDPAWKEPFQGTTVLKAEIVHAIRNEMAQKLADVIFRRTDLGTGGYPGDAAFEDCANLMMSEMGWDQDRLRIEKEEALNAFPAFNRGKY